MTVVNGKNYLTSTYLFYKNKEDMNTSDIPTQIEYAKLLRQWILQIFPDYETYVPPIE